MRSQGKKKQNRECFARLLKGNSVLRKSVALGWCSPCKKVTINNVIIHLQVSESNSQTFIMSVEYQREIMIWRISVNDILTAGGFGEVVWKGQDLRNWDYLRVRGGLGMARSEKQEILDVKEGGRREGLNFCNVSRIWLQAVISLTPEMKLHVSPDISTAVCHLI